MTEFLRQFWNSIAPGPNELDLDNDDPSVWSARSSNTHPQTEEERRKREEKEKEAEENRLVAARKMAINLTKFGGGWRRCTPKHRPGWTRFWRQRWSRSWGRRREPLRRLWILPGREGSSVDERGEECSAVLNAQSVFQGQALERGMNSFR